MMRGLLRSQALSRRALLQVRTPPFSAVTTLSRYSTASATPLETAFEQRPPFSVHTLPVPQNKSSKGIHPVGSPKLELLNAVGRIMQLRKSYVTNRHLFVSGQEMHDLLVPLGAKEEDFARLQGVSDHLGEDPTLPYREIKQGRIIFDYENNNKSIYRGEKQPFILSKDEGFKRHDSDSYRMFPEVADDLQYNTVLQALLRFKTFFFHDVEIAHRPYQDYTSDKWICTLFNVRTFTSDKVLGEPALEGVHSDGVDHTMVTLLGHDHITNQSARTFIHDMREKTGLRTEETNGSLVRGVAQHWDFLDTVLIVDHERYHSLTPVWRVDESRRATRDVLIFFTRRPALEGHASHDVDSTVPHKTLPMRIPIE